MKSSFLTPLTLIIGFLLMIIPYYGFSFDGEEEDSVSQVVYLNTGIVITAQRANTQVFNRPELISTLTSRQMSFHSPATTPDALALLPGVFLQKTNLGGGSPFIRGLTGYHTLILIDGIRINNSIFRSGPNQYLNTIDPHLLRKIEVMKGGGATQYGSDALGGTMHLLTRDPGFNKGGFDFGLNLYGKYWHPGMEKSGRMEMTAGNEWLGILGGLSYKDFGDILAGGVKGKLVPTGYSEIDADFKTIVKLSKLSEITGAYQFTRQNDIPLYHKVANNEYSQYDFDPQQRSLGYLRFNRQFNGQLLSALQLTASHQNGLEKRVKRENESVDREIETDEINTLGLEISLNSQFSENWNATSGIDIYSDNVNSEKIISDLATGESAYARGLYPDNSNYRSLGAFSLHSIETGYFLFQGGVRYNMYRINLIDSAFGDLSIRPSALTGNLGLTWKVDEDKRITFSGNSGYRAPNINDVSSFGIADFRYEVPSYDLKPERSLTGELGYKQKGSKLSFGISGFYNRLFDLIINQPATFNGLDSLSGYQIYRKENIGGAYITGLEFALEWLTLSNLISSVDLTYSYGHNILDNEPLRRIPPLSGRAGFKYFTDQFQVYGNIIYAARQSRLSQGDIDDSRIPEGGTPGWTVMNITGSYEAGNTLFKCSVRNIFNEFYKTHGSGIEGVGRSLWLSAEIRL